MTSAIQEDPEAEDIPDYDNLESESDDEVEYSDKERKLFLSLFIPRLLRQCVVNNLFSTDCG